MDRMLVGVADTCVALGLGRTTVYRLINANKLETVFIGKRRLIRTESIRRLAGEKVDA